MYRIAPLVPGNTKTKVAATVSQIKASPNVFAGEAHVHPRISYGNG
jgi:hypothetical protein